jgi:hypothetical protein
MTYTIDQSLADFNAWSGGKDTLAVLIEKGVCDEVEEFIEQCFTDPTDTDINDFLWFERDQIAEYLGYDDWEAFENGEETYKDINGVELAVSDEVYWHDEAGCDEDGSMITFIIVEENGDGYFNLAYADEEDENPSRWAYYTELEIV